MAKIPKHTTSPLPWKLKTRRTTMTSTLVVGVVDANGDVVIDEVRDEDGAAYADYKLIVDAVNAHNKTDDRTYICASSLY